MGFGQRLAHAWDAFTQQGDNAGVTSSASYGVVSSIRPDRIVHRGSDRSIIGAIYNRIGIDVASIDIRHVRVDDQGQFQQDMPSSLNSCLTVAANLDQPARAFRQDIAMTLFERGVVAIVPVETTLDPTVSAAYDIKTLRVGEVTAWYPGYVRVRLYNEKTGRREELTLSKEYVAIVENPLFSVMNEPNGTLQRLIRKLSLLDYVDEQASSGKLDLIIQLPYVIKSEARRDQAENRRKDIEMQLKGSKYGIAYTDGTEKITQLNRPIENNMLAQIEYLTNLLYAQLGITPEVFNGTASEAIMLNYYNRTVEPILSAISESMKRTFLTKTALSQLQSIEFYRDPFKLVPMSTIADIADKFTRNEVLSSNEIRSKIGMKPSNDPKASQLVNSNMPQAVTGVPSQNPAVPAAVASAPAPRALPAAVASVAKTPVSSIPVGQNNN